MLSKQGREGESKCVSEWASVQDHIKYIVLWGVESRHGERGHWTGTCARSKVYGEACVKKC